MSKVAKKLILLERNQRGELLRHPVLNELHLTAQPGSTYTLIEEDTHQPPKGMVLKRKDHTLVIEDDQTPVAAIDEFYHDPAAAFSTDGSFSGAPETTVSPAPTPATAADVAEHVVWPASHDTAGLFGGFNPVLGVLGGAAAIGLAAGGGGHGSAGSGNDGSGNDGGTGPAPVAPDTTPPSKPGGVDVVGSDANDGSNPTNGVDIKVMLPSDAQIGDKIITVVQFNGSTVATIETAVTATDVAHGYATQHVNYTSIDADGVIADGTYATVTHLVDAAGNSGDAFTNTQAFVAFTGLVHDDYVANATVFIDSNNNGKWDAGEATTTTDSHGYFKFAFNPNGAPVLALGGIDTASGTPNNTIVYKAYSGNLEASALGVDVVLSPLSTLIAAVAEQSAGAGQAVDAAALSRAVTLVNDTLGLGAADPVSLLSYDPVAQAASAGATAQDIALLTVNRQLGVLLGATGALIDGAAGTTTNAGGSIATGALADLLLSRATTQTSLNLASASDVESVLNNAVGRANGAGVTADLRASNPADLTAVAGLVAGFTDAVDKATTQGALSDAALSTMRAASDTLFTALSSAGSEAQSQRGGDLSLAAAVAQVSTITNVADYVANQVTAVKDTTTTFETNTAVGHVGSLVHLDFQLPSLGLSTTVDTLTVSGVPAGASLVLVNPLTQATTVLTPDANGAYQVRPADAGYLAVRATTALVDDPATPAAENALTLTATKVTDGVTTTYTGTLQLQITPAPAITHAVVGTVSDDTGGQTGTLAAGGRTDDATPSLRGSLDGPLTGGQKVAVYDGPTLLGYATVDGTGWTFAPTTPLADGNHALTVRVEAADGSPVSASQPFAVTVDTTPPGTPVIAPTGGGTITGTAEPGAVITLTSGGTVLGTTKADAQGGWSFTPASPLADGSTLTATATDAAGNTSTTPGTATVDAGVPPQSVTLHAGTGSFTTDATPTLGGTLSTGLGTGETLVVYDGDQRIGTATVTGTTWTFTPETDLGDGTHSITVRVVRDTGDTEKPGAPSAPLVFTVDTVAPGQEITVTPALDDVPAGTGAIPNDASHVTNDAIPAFSGTLSAALAGGEALVAYDTRTVNGAQVTVRLGVASVNGTAWTFNPSYALADASHSITFRVEDAAGNVGAASSPYRFTVDTVDTAVPTITSSANPAAVAENIGASQVIYRASADDSADVSGGVRWSLKAGSDAGLTIDATTGAVTLAANPDYETKSAYSFTVVATDAAGNRSEQAVTLAVDNLDEVAPTITSAATAAGIKENSGAGQLVYTAAATDSADISGGVSFSLKAGSDAGLTIDATTGAVTLAANPDYETKSAYSFTVVATDVAGNRSEQAVTLAIANDDAPLALTVSETQVLEGAAGAQKVLTYTVSRTVTTGAGSVDWSVGGTIDAGSDLTGATSGTLSFAAGEASKTFTVTVAGDTAIEANENLVVSLANAQGDLALGAASSATTAIVNDDGTVGISVDRTDIIEGSDGDSQVLTYTITRTNGAAASTVDWALRGVDAADLAPGQAVGGTVSFAADELSKTITVTVRGDKVVEGNESLAVTLSHPGDNLQLGTATATTLVRDDDSLISVDAMRGSVVEGNNGETQMVVYRLVRTGGDSATTVAWSLGGTADAADLAPGQATSGTVSFAANETEKFVSIAVTGDRRIEGDESLTLTLSAPGANAAIGVAGATTTIVNDDKGVSIEAVATTVAEGGMGDSTPLVFRVVRSDGGSAASVDYQVIGVGSEAVGATDFVANQGQAGNGGLPSGTVHFAVGETAVLVTVQVAGDAVNEADEALSVVLVNPSAGLQILQGQVAGTIVNDDVSYSINAQEVATLEGTNVGGVQLGGVQHFTVTRSGDASHAGTVGYTIAGYGDNNASADDFTSLVTGTVSFAAGQTVATLAIDIAGDSQLEGYEAFKVSLNATDGNTEIGQGVALATINPDDVGISIAATNSRTFEDGGGAHTFTLTRTGYLGGTAVVSWHVEGAGTPGYAADADDFGGEFPGGTVTFAPGVDSIQISFTPRADLDFENNEGYRVVLGTAQPGVILLQDSADGMLLNDETGLTLVASDLDKMEGNPGDTPAVSFSVVRTGNIATESVVEWTLVPDGASAADFAPGTPLSGTITFAVGQDSKVISLPLSVDNLIEPDKQFHIQIASHTIGTSVLVGEVNGVIRNDDAQFALQPLDPVAEGNGGSKTVTMTVVRTGDLTGADTVDYTVSGGNIGTAADSADFAGNVFPHGTVLFTAGQSVATITLNLAADSVKEDNETFTVTLGNNSNGTTIADTGATQTVTILNDDDRLAIAATHAANAEGGSGLTDFVFTVTRDGDTGKATTVGWSVEGTGAHPANAADFGGTLPSGTVSFAAGETAVTITVGVAGDNANEADESFRVVLGAAPAGTEIATSSATGTIVNDDTGLAITATTTNLAEGDSGTVEHVFTVTRSGVVSGSTTVDWAVTGAADAADFGGTLPSGKISFADGETVKTITLAATGDTAIESTEAFTVTLSNASSNADIQVASANGSIVADDIRIDIAAQAPTVQEGAAGTTRVLSYTLTRSGDTASQAVVDWAASGMDAGDFAADTPFSGHVTFAAGQTTQVINLTLKGDNVYESDETLTVTLSNTGSNPAQAHTYLGAASAQTVVANDDVALAIAADAASQAEGGAGATTPFVFTITPTGVIGADSVVSWRVSSAQAASNDFAAGQDALGDNNGLPSGTVTFAPGQTSAIQITVNVAGDSAVESAEAFSVTLSTGAANVEIATASAGATIANDDTAFAIAAVTSDQPEGNTGTTAYTFDIVRSGVATGTAKVSWQVAGSGAHAADAADFDGGVLPSGTVTFTGTETTKTVTVLVAGDTAVEFDEGFTVQITDAPNLVTVGQATAVIRNEDQQFAVSAANPTLVEGDSDKQPLIFTVTRTGDTSVAATVGYAVTGSAGVDAADIVGSLPSGTLSFGANEGQKLVTVQVRGDSLAEADDTYTLTLSAPSTGTLDPAATTAQTVVTDNDVALAISAPGAAPEGSRPGEATPFVFTVTRSGATASTETVVDWIVEGGTTSADFVAGQDGLNANFGLPSGKLTFAAGATVATITVNVAQDHQVELDETLKVTLQHPTTSNVELHTASASTTILADDSGYSIAAVDAAHAEGQGGNTAYVFSITRAGDLSQGATAHWAVSGSGGNPATAADFAGNALPAGDVSFAANESVQLVTVLVAGDQVAEPDENFIVTLSGVQGIVDATAAGTIGNDDQNFSVSSSPSIAEGQTSTRYITFTVARSGDMSAPATVDYDVTTPNGSADDYVGSLPAGTLSFAKDEAQQVVTLAIRGDTVVEGDESYTLTLTNPTGGATLGTAQSMTVVANDDTNFVLSAPADAAEGGSGSTPFVFTVTRTGDTSGAGSVQWKLQGAPGVATDDFTGSQDALGSNNGLPSGTVSFAAGVSVAHITINVQGDTTIESNETLHVVLSNPAGGTIEGTDGDKSAVVLTDDDRFAISGTVSTWETQADHDLVYTITRTGSLTGERVLSWNIGGSNGFVAADDLAAGQAASGTITFIDGQPVGYLTVGVKGDSVSEADETMTITLSNAPANTVLGTASADTVILNDDAKVGITPLLANHSEGNPNGVYVDYTFTVTRSGYIDQSSTVHYSIDTTAANSVDVTDFRNNVLPSGTVSFGAGETTKVITLQMAEDNTLEPDETVRVQLTGVSAGTEIDAAHASADGTVVNDDARFDISTATSSVVEGDNGFAGTAVTYTVTRTGNLSQTNTVQWSVGGGTADATDFSNHSTQFFGNTSYYNQAQLPNGTLTFSSGVSMQTVTVYVRGDTGVDTQTYYDSYWEDYDNNNLGSTENDETFKVTLSSASDGSSVGTASAQTTITNDDTRLTVSVDNAYQAEKTAGGGTTDYVYTVVRSGSTAGTTSVNWSVANYGTDANDFGGTLPSGTVSFAAGETVKTVTVHVQGDDTVENQEMFALQLNGGSGYDEISSPNNGLNATTGLVYSYINRDEATFNIIGYGNSSYGYLQTVNEGDSTDDGGTGSTAVVITVQRSLASAGPATVNWTVNGMAPTAYPYDPNAQAASADDFVGGVLPSGTLSFADGETLGYITVYVKGDDLGEMNEGFQVQLTGTSAGSGVGSNGSGYVVINNDDTTFSAALTKGNVVEGQDLVYTITRNDDVRGSDTIHWSWQLPGAENGNEKNTDPTTWYKLDPSDLASDANGVLIKTQDGSTVNYDPETRTYSGTITFTDQQATRTITITTVDDSLTESWHEAVPALVIDTPTNVHGENGDQETPIVEANRGSTAATWVYDNDADPLLSVGQPSSSVVWEGTDVVNGSQTASGGTVVFTVLRTDGAGDGSLNYPTVAAWKLTGSGLNGTDLNNSQPDVQSYGDAANVWRYDANTTYGTVSFAAGETSKTVTVTFNADSYAEADEVLNFSVLSAAEAESVGVSGRDYGPANVDTSASNVNVTLMNDDVQLSLTPQYTSYHGGQLGAYEGQPLAFTISRSGRTDVDVTVTYTLSGAAVDSGDITGTLTGTVTIPAGQSSVLVTLPSATFVDDSAVESNEAFSLTLTAQADDSDHNVYVRFNDGTSNTMTASGQVFDDDSTYTITNMTPAAQAELDNATVDYVFKVQRTNNGSTDYAHLNWKVVDLGGITSADFVTGDGLGTNGGLPSGQTGWIDSNGTAYITVKVRSDLQVEGNDAFKVIIDEEQLYSSGITNTFTTPFSSATQTITNDDTGISIADRTIAESDGNQSMVFTVIRTGDLSGVSTMDWAVSDLTTNSADFVGARSGSLSFGAGVSVQTITLTVAGDVTPEQAETFNVTLSNLSSDIDDPIDTQALGTIDNDDSSFAVSAGAAVAEGGGQVFTITRTHATVQDQVVSWTVSGAANGATAADFGGSFPTGTVTFAGTELTKTITVTSSADTVTETGEDYTVTIGLGAGTTGDVITTSTATGTIVNNDADYTVTANSAAIMEGHDGTTPVVFTVTRTGALDVPATVTWTLTGTADGADLGPDQATTGTVSFAANAATATIIVNVVGDTAVEADDTLVMTLSNPSGADGNNVTGGPATTTVTNDDASIAIVAVDAEKAEGNSGTTAFVFDVVRTGYLGAAATVQYAVGGSGAHPADSADFNGMTGTLDLPANQATPHLTILVNADQAAEFSEGFTVTLSNPSAGVVITGDTADGTIVTDDTWIDIAPPAAQLEGTGGGTTDFAFVVTRSGDVGATQVLGWTVAGSGGNPASPSDFAATAGNVTFAPNETVATIHVQVNQDAELEATEQFTLALTGPAGLHFSHTSADSSIIDDETAFSITPTTLAHNEGATGVTNYVFTVTRSGNTSHADTVDWNFSSAQADADDFDGGLPGGGTLSFAASETTKTITIGVLGDQAFENDEAFTIGLTGNSAGTQIVPGAASATATIRNDDSRITISALAADHAEGQAGTTAFTFDVVRTGDLSTQATVEYALSGTGIDAADFAGLAGGLTGTLGLAANQATTTVTIYVQGDRVAESDETFTVTLSNPSTGMTITGATANGVIRADDVVFDVAPPVQASVAEGGMGDVTNVAFVVTRAGKLDGVQVLNWSVEGVGGNAADSADFVAMTGAVTFAAGETAHTVTVQVKGDYVFEPDESFRLTVAPASGDDLDKVTFTRGTADAVILNDEAAFAVAATDADKVEGPDGTVDHVFTVTRTGNLDLTSTVEWAAVAGSADASDFAGSALPHGALTFAAGSSVQTITVQTVGDTQTETDETFTVQLSNASTGANIVTGSAGGKIISDDVSWSVSTESIPATEGDGSSAYVFKVVRTGGTAATSVDWSVAGNGTNAADAADFAGGQALPSGNIVFAQDVMTQFITVQVAGDSLREADEGFAVTLAARADGLTHAYERQTATAVIVNDDDVMSIAAVSADKAEGSAGSTPFTFTVTRDGSLAGVSTVGWQVVHGDTDAADFGATSGVVTFADGQSAATVTVNVVGDRGVEGDQAFGVALVNAGAGSTIDAGHGSADGIIRNDDVDLALTAGTVNVVEGDAGNPGQATFTVTRTGDLSVATTVDWNVVAGTAGAADFAGGQLPGGTVTFAAGESVKTITVALAGDGADEGLETYSVRLSNPSAEADITANDVAGSIVNDDDTLAVSAFQADAPEGNDGVSNYVFKVERTGSATGSATVDWAVAGSGDHAVGTDEFVATAGSVSFADGETSTLVTVQVKGDAVGEYDETFTLALSNPSYGSTVAGNGATGTVRNDDAVLFLRADQPGGVAEGVNGAETEITFTVVRSGDASATSRVDWQVSPSGDHATNAMDFGGAYPSGTVVFGVGETTKQITVKALGDADGEFDETFTVALSNPQQATILEGSAGSVILNDDTGISIVAQGPTVQAEGNSGTTDFVYRVERVGDLSATTVDWAMAGSGDYPAQADDFTGPVAGTISFAASETSRLITLHVAGDDQAGPDEAFRVVLSNNAHLINTEAAGIVRNDDSVVAITANMPLQPEGNSGATPFVFMVTRSGATDVAADVAWEVVGNGGHPVDAADFGGALPAGTVHFAAGETSQLVTVAVSGDTLAETDEGFAVRLSAATGSGVTVDPTAAQATAVIGGDDQGVLIFGLDTDHAEGQAGSNTTYTYQILRTGNSTEAVTVNYAIGGAVDQDDFVSPLSGSFVMAAGETSRILTLTARGDNAVELDEAFQVALAGAFASNGAAGGMLRADDDGISIVARHGSATEGDGTVVYDVIAAGLLPGDTAVDWAVDPAARDSVEASDFDGNTLPGGTLHFTGDGTQSITLQLADDTTVEPNETITVALHTSGPAGSMAGDHAVVTVADNDSASAGNDRIEGNDTADVLAGHGGADVIAAGGGDDVVVLDADNLAQFGHGMQVDGGDGIDTLFFDTADQTIDLAALTAHVTGVEKVDISGTGANKLVVGAADLAGMATDVFSVPGADSGLHQLMVEGDANDKVVIADFGNGWAKETAAYSDGHGTYDVYTNAAQHAQLLINIAIAQQTGPQPT